MALEKQGSKVIAKITDLSQESSFNNGDRIVFWCNSTGEASTIDYANVKIDLDHTTFGTAFTQVLNFSTTAAAWVTEMSDSFDDLTNQMDTLVTSNATINNQILALQMLIKMILGLASARDDLQANFSEQQYIDSMPDEAKTYYEQTKQDVLNATGADAIDFTRQNLTYLASAAAKSIENEELQNVVTQAELDALKKQQDQYLADLQKKQQELLDQYFPPEPEPEPEPEPSPEGGGEESGGSTPTTPEEGS